MPRVLVIGATGYLGTAVSAALVRAGYTVHGLARDERKAQALAAREIIPVRGSVEDSAGYLELVRRRHIDAVIDAAGAYDGSYKILSDLAAVGRERLELARREAADAGSGSGSGSAPVVQKLAFIYTSGMWVHGSSDELVGNVDPVGVPSAAAPPAKLVAWRPALERAVLASADVLDVAVLRPALMYGQSSSAWAPLLGPVLAAAQQQQQPPKIDVSVDTTTLTAVAHVEDVALGYVQAVEKVHLLAGTGVTPVFDLYTTHESLFRALQAFARAIGYRGQVNAVAPGADDVYGQALNAHLNADSLRARTLLGWQPTRIEGFTSRIEVYAGAYAAAAASARH